MGRASSSPTEPKTISKPSHLSRTTPSAPEAMQVARRHGASATKDGTTSKHKTPPRELSSSLAGSAMSAASAARTNRADITLRDNAVEGDDEYHNHSEDDRVRRLLAVRKSGSTSRPSTRQRKGRASSRRGPTATPEPNATVSDPAPPLLPLGTGELRRRPPPVLKGLSLGPSPEDKLKVSLELDLAHIDASEVVLHRKRVTQPPVKAAHGGLDFEKWKMSAAHDQWFKEQMALTSSMNSFYSSYGSNS
jgi:hypothetical protein